MPEDEKEQKRKQSDQPVTDVIVEKQQVVTVNGQELRYKVTTGTLVLKEETEKKEKAEGEKAQASIFFVAYTLEDGEDQRHRPLTFSFNGGPGSSSVWLHLGVLGPRRVNVEENGRPVPPPYRLADNEYTLLDQTDLVFIDPVNTGFSRMVPGEKQKKFLGFQKDIESVGDFIRLYTTRYQRWSSPKFLIGESYGTTRAAGLSGYLQQRHGMYINGIILISSILNFQTARFTPGNDLPYILFLPSYTATAWYHGQLPAELQTDLPQTLAEVEAFAMGEYTLALMKGAALPDEERATIVAKLAQYTGLSAAYIERTNLRINIHRFCKELLREQRRTVGRLDSRFTGIDQDSAGELSEFDPSYAIIQGPYTATFNDYVRRELGFEIDLPYETISMSVNLAWSYEQHQNEFVNVAETLRQAMNINPYLQIFVANGFFDLATPYLATAYTFNHLGLDPSLQSHISMAYYEAGHMMYTHQPSLAQLKQDLTNFIQNLVPD